MSSNMLTFGGLQIGMTVSLALATNRGRKYVTAAPHALCDVGYIDIMDEGSQLLCCRGRLAEDLKLVPEMCKTLSYFAGIEKVMVSSAALFLPLLPLAISVLFSTDRLRRDTLYRRRVIQRFVLYVVAILFRTFVLYYGVNALEKAIQGPPTDQCWYSELRPKGRCKDNFNIGDHLVLMIVHYIAIPMFEVNASKMEDEGSLSYFIVNLVTKAIVFCGCLNSYLSTAYFHTRAESFVGFTLAVVTVLLPFSLLIFRYAKELELANRVSNYSTAAAADPTSSNPEQAPSVASKNK